MKAGIDYIGVAVGIFLINEEGKVFLTKRSKNATNERGTWEIPGGKLHFGETLQDAAKREANEEYGIDIELIKQFPAQNHILLEEAPTLGTYVLPSKNCRQSKTSHYGAG